MEVLKMKDLFCVILKSDASGGIPDFPGEILLLNMDSIDEVEVFLNRNQFEAERIEKMQAEFFGFGIFGWKSII
jgi:hypothetical protein